MRILYLSYERGLEIAERGHEVLYTDIEQIRTKGFEQVKQEIRDFRPELVIEREFNDGKASYEMVYDFLREAFPKAPRCWWWIDSHLNFDQRIDYARRFDYLFLAVSVNVERLRKSLGHQRVFWLPLCWPYRADAILPNHEEKTQPIVFVGRWDKENFPDRTAYIERLREHYGGAFLALTDYEKMLTIIRGSRVAFNCAIRGDLNFRVFEVLGSATELVTDDVPDLHKIRGLEEKLTIYKDWNDLVAKIDRLLANDPRATHDTLKTQQWVKERHCLVHRHQALLEMVATGTQKEF